MDRFFPQLTIFVIWQTIGSSLFSASDDFFNKGVERDSMLEFAHYQHNGDQDHSEQFITNSKESMFGVFDGSGSFAREIISAAPDNIIALYNAPSRRAEGERFARAYRTFDMYCADNFSDTTLCALTAKICRNTLTLAHTGNCRAMLFRPCEIDIPLRMKTDDHTFCNEFELHRLRAWRSAQELAGVKKSNLTRFFGSHPLHAQISKTALFADPEIITENLKHFDTLLLATRQWTKTYDKLDIKTRIALQQQLIAIGQTPQEKIEKMMGVIETKTRTKTAGTLLLIDFLPHVRKRINSNSKGGQDLQACVQTRYCPTDNEVKQDLESWESL